MTKPAYDVSIVAGQKRLMDESVGRPHVESRTIVNKPGVDYGCDPMGDGTFRMVPSGDVVSFEEMKLRRGIK